jgi:phage terminase large subunit-like protein
VLIAIAYAEEACEDRGGHWTCRWTRLAARRFIVDLRRSQGARPPFFFSAKRANHVCSFIEQLPHVEDSWQTANITLEAFQIFFLVNLFGFRNKEGGRRFTTGLLAIARKNAKSTLAAAIMIYCLCCEKTNGPQVLSAATTGSQARIVWGIAKKMIDASPDLSGTFDLECFANAIARYEVAGTFKPINSKASTQDGLNPSHTVMDEIHAHKTHDLLNVLTSAAGARANPLWLYTTTEGYETPGPWPELRNFAESTLQRVGRRADHFFCVIYAVDEKDDDFDESRWIKANPLMAANPRLGTEIRKMAIDARMMPGRLAEMQIKRLNRRASSAAGWINLPRFRRCSGPVPLEELVGLPCWGGLDLASTADMVAWRMLWLREDTFYTWGRFWVCEDAIAQRTERQSANYAGWVQAGWLSRTEGNAVDYDIIERDILEDCGRFSPGSIGYDTWNATQLASSLVNQGAPLVQFIQGPRSYNPAMQAFERAYLLGKLRHEGSPILTWNAANLVARRDANMNMAPNRKKSADKIDGMCALFMAFGVALVDDQAAFEHMLASPVSA